MIGARTLRQLRAVDWDFPTDAKGTLRAIHWYPGTFPSQLPGTLVQAFTDDNDLVCDPYCGIGTTAAEALRLGRRAIFFEQNPIGFLTSYVSAGLNILRQVSKEYATAVLDAASLVLAESAVDQDGFAPLFKSSPDIRSQERYLSVALRPTPARALRRSFASADPRWDLLEQWFARETLCELRRMLHVLAQSEGIGHFSQLLTLVMLSSVLRSVSSQTRSWGHIADNVRPDEFVRKSLISSCNRWLNRTRNLVEQVDIMPSESTLASPPRAFAYLHDWTKGSAGLPENPEKAKLLVTSPPYVGAIDYTLAQRLSLYLFGYTDDELMSLCRTEIGARRQRFSSNREQAWADSLVAAAEHQIKYVADDGYLCFVLPHKDAGRELGLRRLEEFFVDGGWRKAFERDRSIRQARTRHRWTSIKQETIVAFCRG